jgi:transglutaminase-like putative cysteine protease
LNNGVYPIIPGSLKNFHAPTTRVWIATSLLAMIITLPGFTPDPFNYCIEVKNFSKRILSEETSRFRIASADTDFALPETRFQKIVSRESRAGKESVEIVTGPRNGPVTENVEIGRYLKNTRFLNLDSPEITDGAAHLRGSADPLKAVEEFVYGRISDKTTGIPLAPASQIFRNRQGDCTEHAVLAVAILRKLGIPARAVVGMYLSDAFQGRTNVFVFHMWAEAYYRGEWRIVDAALHGAGRPNCYVAFAYHNLKTEAPLSYLRAVSSIRNLSVEYLGH